MADEVDGREKPTFSFGFKRKKENKILEDSKLRDDTTKDEKRETEYVLSLEENKINSTVPKAEKKELVIPLILKNTWRVPSGTTATQPVDSKDDSLEARAAREIIEETKNANGGSTSGRKDSLVIPIFIQNRIPDGYETEDKLDVSLRAEESTLEDYEQVPIEEYGLAMLRGMGWKPGDPIGGANKQVVKPVETVVRPKGLGLGADRAGAERLAKMEVESGMKGLMPGAFIKIIEGSLKGQYGQIEGKDEDTARIIVRLALGGKAATIAQYAVIEVSPQQYKDRSLHPPHNENKPSKESSDSSREMSAGHRERSKKDRTNESKEKRHRKHKKRKHSDDSDSEESSAHETSFKPWVRPSLKVRFINKEYKHGRYYNTKVVVLDVASIEACTCKTDDRKILDGISQNWLETVIPRGSPAYVMIVHGSHSGKLGEILEKDKSKCQASIQLLQEKNIVLKLDYDSICEYVGDINALDY